MAESKTQDPNKSAPISVAVEDNITDEELDQVIAEEDPDFLKSVEEIGADKELSLSQIEISDEQQALNEEKDAWAHSGKIGRSIFRAFPGVAVLSLKTKKLKFSLFSISRGAWVRIKNFFYFLATDGKNKIVGKIKAVVHSVSHTLSESQRNFRFLNWKLKLAVFGILGLMAGTGFFIYKSLTHGVLPTHDELFMPTMERVASEVKEYDPETEVEPFYDNLRASSNILLIPKMVVNLRKSAHSGPNPMGAFEFYVEGMAPEVAIEVKDREIEIRDLMQRVLEEFTFDQVDSMEGKKILVEKLKKEVNLLLTTGKLKKVSFKTVIVKP